MTPTSEKSIKEIAEARPTKVKACNPGTPAAKVKAGGRREPPAPAVPVCAKPVILSALVRIIKYLVSLVDLLELLLRVPLILGNVRVILPRQPAKSLLQLSL